MNSLGSVRLELLDLKSRVKVGVGFWLPIASLIFSDNGGEFCSKEFQDWTEDFNIEHKTSAFNSPFSNGICERNNAVISWH